MPLMVAGGLFAAVAIAGVVFFAGKEKVDPAAREALNRAYLASREYPPPESCETNDAQAIALFTQATMLLEAGKPGSKRAEDAKALSSLTSLEEMFDSARLKDDYRPTGWIPPGATTRAVVGHQFGLRLSEADKAALLAFLRSL